MNKKLKIGGMTCVACASGIERTLKKIKKVKKVEVSFATQTMEIEYEDDLKFKVIENGIKSLGFHIIKDNEEEKDNSKIKLIISIVFTIPLLLIAMLHMIPNFNITYPSIIDPNTNQINFAIIQLILSIPVIICGYKFYTVGFKLLFKGVPNMDSLVAVGTSASFIYSLYSTYKIFTGNFEYVHNLYFESTATIISLVELGKYLESRSRNKTGNAIK